MIGTFIVSFFAGATLANSIPHLTKGTCGERFPKRFPNKNESDPIGGVERILISPLANAIWGIINLIISFLLFSLGKLKIGFNANTLVMIVGFSFIVIFLSINIGRANYKMKGTTK